MLRAESVTYVASGRRLVDGVSLEAPPGRLLAVIGPNGSGKSTLLRMLSGERKPAAGGVTLDGLSIHAMRPAYLASRRAVVPQQTVLSFPFTVLEYVMLGITVPGFGVANVQGGETAHRLVAAVGLRGFEERLFTQLSGGERQRASIARALCQLAVAPVRPGETTVLLLDEPTSSLDLAHQTEILTLLRQEAHNGRVVVVVLHDLNLAAAFADTIILMSGGRAVRCAPPHEVLTDATLSAAYACRVRINAVPPHGRPFIIPGV